jgi:hypothetical protein
MKTEHRHELATNSLARNLEIWIEKLRPHASTILLAIGALVGAYAVGSIWSARSSSQEQRAWETYQRALLDGDADYSSVRDAAQNEDLAGSTMQEWAYVAWADRQLLRAANQYLTNREAAKSDLADAAAIYQQYTGDAAEPSVRSRAQLGLARVAELQNRIDEAKRYYAQVEGPMQPVAEARLKELETNSDEIKEATAWLASAEAPRSAPPTGPGLPGIRPDFDATLPPADGAPPADQAQTMEDIFGGLGDEDPAEPRYPDGQAPATTGETGAADADAAEVNGDSTARNGESAAGKVEAGASSQGDAAETPTSADEVPSAGAADHEGASSNSADATAPTDSESDDGTSGTP